MLVLSLRTDKPEAEIGLFEDGRQLGYIAWQAHRILSETIHIKIKELLESAGRELSGIGGVAVYKGPGSFTGLRIGISVANALAYGLKVPIVSDSGEDWLEKCLDRLKNGKDEKLVQPLYGAEPHITKRKK